ncbi:hypothetical protein KHS38_02400 [Mucilaginibacter sp. Bleaf8]|uniref:hypothetical protein n=1 Tax=Mucilaginibacter sp. Bleaf8 TaxID=2834430 RepID=UPI001BCCBC5C|nr:hypothetical protein [Mucilaginibacter sp. Bleaf8]MBS7563244.1 hypothetical protein [Mucilaginibacter sp. Bleaf8]
MAFGQVEVAPWGNITGIRNHGQLYRFETSLQYIKNDGKQTLATDRERQRPKYRRNGAAQIINTNLDSLYFEETINNAGDGQATVKLSLTSHADTNLTGAYFVVTLPYVPNNDTLQLIGGKTIDLTALTTKPVQETASIAAQGIEFTSPGLKLKIANNGTDDIIIRKDWIYGIEKTLVYFPVSTKSIKKYESISKTYYLQASGPIDTDPVHLSLNTAQQGRKFDGFGGNFRLQNPVTDPQVIDYSLANLRVAWARAEMPWRLWQPDLSIDPIKEAKAGRLAPQVAQAMQMVQRLGKLNIPVILSAWYAPDWAIVGKANLQPVNGIWGNPLNPEQMQRIYQSITDYILYLKDAYGVEAAFFSFNESDLGINIRMTAQEHADFIKGLGAYFASKKLKTKLLLGDNSDATTFNFLSAAMADAEARKYIGAISFHSWRGWDDATLQKWADAATQLQVPLVVGEGSIDASAWQYPAIFMEPTYAREEINLYTRLLAICQPVSILQWQLTADYSPLAGGGIFGDNGTLRPTQRFWNLKQLASTPAGLYAMPITWDQEDVSVAALGDNSKGIYTIHMVNNGASRKVVLNGLPAKVQALRLYITNQQQSFQNMGLQKVAGGKLDFDLPAEGYLTLVSETR